MNPTAPLLGVNIDHVASLRQARYRGGQHPTDFAEPDPARAVHEAELGGADIITVHLREDRRHINDRDVEVIRPLTRMRLNLEMGATEEMLGIARKLHVHMCTLVPEGRQEVTTEGGLDVIGQLARLKTMVAKLKDPAGHSGGGMTVSAFIDADVRQIEACRSAGFDACEIHTGPYANAFAASGGDALRPALAAEIARLADACHAVRAMGMRLHAGHGLNYTNVAHVARIPGMTELHIGHSIVARGIYVGLRQAVADMKLTISRA
jgi:pyridoxine 5-phosphate synthase